MNTAQAAVVFLLAGRWAAQEWLEKLNRDHVRANAGEVPAAYKDFVDRTTYTKSADYSLAKSKLYTAELTWDALVLCILLFSGILPISLAWFEMHLGSSIWTMAAWLFSVGVSMSIIDFPWSWFRQFRLEEKFGFNSSTQKIWWMDRLKGFVLALLLGYPLLLLVLKLAGWMGNSWWLWGWAALIVVQLLMVVFAPILILPLFNKLTPLPDGTLRERLLHLAQKTSFHAKNIQVMDGSKRSRHSNAFFTGFGVFRKIVLFDTLLNQLEEPEVEAVLAHEVGHYQRKHVLKMLLFSAFASLTGFYILSLLARAEWFYAAFGFQTGNIAPALLLFVLLSGLITFWFSPLAHAWSRRYEYEADAFAAQAVGNAGPLVSALRKLNQENLSNLSPHPLYSGFYYSHPTLLEREAALK